MKRTWERVGSTWAGTRGRIKRLHTALRDRNVAVLLGASFVSEIGDWFNTVALISLSYQFGDGALSVGGMLALRMLPRLVLQGPAGSLVDRHHGRRLLFVTHLIMAIVASAFAVLAAFPSLWLLYLLVLLLDTANTVARPAFMVQLRNEAPVAYRAVANGAMYASMTTAQLVGPVLGAVVLGPFGPAAVFFANGVTFLAVAVAVTRLRGGLRAGEAAAPGEQHQEPISPADEETGPTGAATAGYRFLLRQHDLGLYAMLSLSLAILVQATIALFIVRANELGLGDSGVGLFYTAVAAGSLLGSVVAGTSDLAGSTALRWVAVAGGLCALALAGFGLVGALAAAIGVLAIAGFATDFHEVAALGYFQQRLPDEVYGRFFSLLLIALSAGGLLGALLGPITEALVGVGGSLSILAVPALASALILTGVVRRGGPERPPRDEGPV